MSRHSVIGLVAGCFLLLAGCESGDADKAVAQPQLPPVEESEEMNIGAVLIQFRGCDGADGVERTREEALAIAEEVSQAAQGGADFAQLAKEKSDAPNASWGGTSGNFQTRQMPKQIVDANRKLEIGGISGPVETHFGYYVIQRREIETVYNASHILLGHKDSQPPDAAVDRTKEEAMALAEEILKKVEAGENFNELALKYSIGPGRKVGGQMGNFNVGGLPAYFNEVGHQVEKLEIDQLSEPFETEVGIHLVKRQEVPKPAVTLAAKHILVMFQGPTGGDVTRSKEDARARIEVVQEKLLAGSRFEDLAHEYSDCPSNADGGDLGSFRRGDMVPAFHKATAGCSVGGYTDIVETQFGFHIIHRYEPPSPQSRK